MQVYKFLGAHFALDDVRKGRLKISTFEDMNDPFELQGVVFSDVDVQHLLTTHSVLSHGALCFSRNWSNPILCSQYADEHKGICLGFEIGAAVEVREPCYVESRPTIDSRVLVNAAPYAENLSESDPLFQESKKIVAKMLLTKFNGWSYEDEVRMFIRLKADQREGDHYFADFDENIRLNAVITGPRCTVAKGEIEAAVSWYSSPIKFIRTMLSRDSFKVIEDTGYGK